MLSPNTVRTVLSLSPALAFRNDLNQNTEVHKFTPIETYNEIKKAYVKENHH